MKTLVRTVVLVVAAVGVVTTTACGESGESSTVSTSAAASSTTSPSPTPASAVPSSAVPSSLVPSSLVATTAAPADTLLDEPLCDGGLLPAVAAIDRVTGDLQWTYCSADLAWRSMRGATDEDVVFVDATMPDPSAGATEFRQLHELIALDARNGTERWRTAVAARQLGWPAGPFAGSGVVVVGVDDGEGAAIVGLDAGTGDVLWRVAASALGAAAPSLTAPPSVVALLANTDTVAVVSVPSGLVGLDRSSGAQLWSSGVFVLDESGVGTARGPAAVDGTTVLIPAASGVQPVVIAQSGETTTMPVGPSVLTAVDGLTGATLWQGQRLDHPMADEGYAVGYVHAGTGSPSGPEAEIVVVDTVTGEQLWTRPGRESYGDLWALGDGVVVVDVSVDGLRTDVVAYELASGDVRWQRTVGESLPMDPQQVVDDAVVLLWNDLALLSTADGTTRWAIPASISPETPMSSVDHNAASLFVSFNSRPWGD